MFVEKSPANGAALVDALRELGFALTEPQADEIRRSKDFVHLKNGPFGLGPGIRSRWLEHFEDTWRAGSKSKAFPDIIASKAATNRVKDWESLPRLRSFHKYWLSKHTH